MAWDKRVPHDAAGNMLNYLATELGIYNYATRSYDPITWVDASKPFKTALQPVDYERGRSKTNITLKRLDTGGTVEMQLGDFMDVVRSIQNEWLPEMWLTFVKRGANYLCQPAECQHDDCNEHPDLAKACRA